MRTFLFLALLGCCVALPQVLLGQYSETPKGSLQNDIPIFIPPSPNATALAKFANVAPSIYSGVQDISIPLYDLSFKELHIPVGLSYHPSGIKVEEKSSQVGLGWALNAGGVIARVIRHRDDFLTGGYANPGGTTFANVLTGTTYNCTANPEYTEDALRPLYGDSNRDTEPDMFYFNFAGYTGRFVMRQDGSVQLITQADIIITPNYDINLTPSAWTITLPNGNKYIFGQEEKTAFTFSCTQLEDEFCVDPNNENNYSTVGGSEVTTAWYLTEIDHHLFASSPQTNANFYYIKFNYSTLNNYNVYTQHLGTTKFIASEGQDETNNCKNCYNRIVSVSQQLSHKEVQLSSITTPVYSLFFYYDAKCGSSAGYKLTNIKLSSDVGATPPVLKQYNFAYETCAADNRLWLKNIQEVSNGNITTPAVSIPPYTFEYYNHSDLATANTKEQDWWGYFNDNNMSNQFSTGTYTATANPDPFFVYPANTVISTSPFSGVSRRVNPSTVHYGSLRKIVYPTKGHSIFEYEPNEFAATSNSNTGYGFFDSTTPDQTVNIGNGTVSNCSLTGTAATGTITITEPVGILKFAACFATATANSYVKLVNSTGQCLFAFVPAGISSVSGVCSGATIVTTTNTLSSNYIALANGTYTLSTEGSSNIRFQAVLHKLKNDTRAGGIRIQKVTQYNHDATTSSDTDNPRIAVTRYDYTSGTASSGKLLIPTDYMFINPQPGVEPMNQVFVEIVKKREGDVTIVCNYAQVCTTPCTMPLCSYATGETVGYDLVTVSYGDATAGGGNVPPHGKTQYYYVDPTNAAISYNQITTTLGSANMGQGSELSAVKFLFPPLITTDHKNGYIAEIRQLTNDGTWTQKQRYSYTFTDNTPVQGLRLKGWFTGVNQLTYDIPNCAYVAWAVYGIPSTRVRLSSEDTDFKDIAGNTISTSNTYTYRTTSPFLLASNSFTNSDGAVYSTEYKYPHDYTACTSPAPSSNVAALNRMKNSFMANYPIQITHKKGTTVLYRQLSTYTIPTVGTAILENPVVEKTWDTYNTTSTETSISATCTLNIDNSFVEQDRFSEYDLMGNVLRYTPKNNGTEIVTTWGTNDIFPINRKLRLTNPAATILQEEDIQYHSAYKEQVINSTQRNSDTNASDDIVTKYSYDDIGRIKDIKDYNDRLIKLYEYNFKQ